jgi:hypothetical protein
VGGPPLGCCEVVCFLDGISRWRGAFRAVVLPPVTGEVYCQLEFLQYEQCLESLEATKRALEAGELKLVLVGREREP